MPLPKYRNKIIQLFSSITDDSIRNIISEAIALEYDHRSSSKVNFDRKKLEDIVDREARLIEMEKKKEGGK
jgi:hypothetical protein